MWYNRIKSEKGITLASLVTYIIILTMVMGILATISTFFYSNIGEVVDVPRYINEFNKFTMFFGVDIKNYSDATVSDNTIEFEGGPVYKYKNNAIYRNNVQIAENILDCKFTDSIYQVNTTEKEIIKVYMKIGKDSKDNFEQVVDFTLKYW